MEIVPEPGEYPVKAGQVIALSGNTGYSFGPHLHLDMIESATGDYIDPLPFFMEKVKDNTAPHPVSATGQRGGKRKTDAPDLSGKSSKAYHSLGIDWSGNPRL